MWLIQAGMWIGRVAALEPRKLCQFGSSYLTHLGFGDWSEKHFGDCRQARAAGHGPGGQVPET